MSDQREARDEYGRVLCCHGRPIDCWECGQDYADELNAAPVARAERPSFEKNGIRMGERVVCIDVPRNVGTVTMCSDSGVTVLWDDGQEGELIWREDVAYNAYRLQIVRAERREAPDLTDEAKWIRRKLKLPEDASSSGVYGRMHVWEAHAHGYVTYIEAFKCDDKQGEIARLTVEVERLRAALSTQREAPDLPATLQKALDLLEDTYGLHRNRKEYDSDWEGETDVPCAWCEDAKPVIEALRAALSSQEPPLPLSDVPVICAHCECAIHECPVCGKMEWRIGALTSEPETPEKP